MTNDNRITRITTLARRLCSVGVLLGFAATAAEALPMSGATAGGGGSPALSVQHNPGVHKRREYRRELRRYRGDPGAQYILRNKRRVFCRRNPQYC